MFIDYLWTDPHHYVFVVVTLVFSIVLHELAHGVVALRLGDPTPRELGHITVDPVVHLGVPSLLMVAVLGMGFGAMPVDPTRMRGRRAEGYVALAGPLCNLLLGGLALTGMAIWRLQAAGDLAEVDVVAGNLTRFVWVVGYVNVALGLYNLLPLVPFDGGTALATWFAPYRRWRDSVTDPRVHLWVFAGALLLLSQLPGGLYGPAMTLSTDYVQWIYGLAGR